MNRRNSKVGDTAERSNTLGEGSLLGASVPKTSCETGVGVRGFHFDALRAGEFLGRYELLSHVARGGMATVWAARLADGRGLQRLVAVKAMLPHIRHDPDAEHMFIREAEIASKVRHENVVELLDLGEERDVLYIVMEWVRGEALGNIATEAARVGGIPIDVGIQVGLQLCEGLHAAHEATDDHGTPLRLVHRDVSPQNILVGFDGIVKVADFGIAKVQSETGLVTEAGFLKGKAGYMAPEQISFEPVDRRTDIFAAAVVLYLITTGRHPFRQKGQRETADAIRRADPRRPTTFVKNYPKQLEQAILKALSKNPGERYATARDFANDLALTLPPAMDRTGPRVVQEYVRGLMPHRVSYHDELAHQAFVSESHTTSVGSSSGRTPSTLRAVARSRHSTLGPYADILDDASHSDTKPSFRIQKGSRERLATTVLAAGLGMLVGAVGMSSFTLSRSADSAAAAHGTRPSSVEPKAARQSAPADIHSKETRASSVPAAAKTPFDGKASVKARLSQPTPSAMPSVVPRPSENGEKGQKTAVEPRRDEHERNETARTGEPAE